MDAAYGLQDHIVQTQNKYAAHMEAWDSQITLNKQILPFGQGYKWTHPDTCKLAILPDKTIRRHILQEWHNHEAGGHPGQEETI